MPQLNCGTAHILQTMNIMCVYVCVCVCVLCHLVVCDIECVNMGSIEHCVYVCGVLCHYVVCDS